MSPVTAIRARRRIKIHVVEAVFPEDRAIILSARPPCDDKIAFLNGETAFENGRKTQIERFANRTGRGAKSFLSCQLHFILVLDV